MRDVQVLTSIEPPMLSTPPTSGRVTSDGTKKTGSHLASNVAPGVRMRCSRLSFVDDDDLDISKRIARITPQPPSDEGNLLAMPNLWNKRRKAMSRTHQIPTDKIGF